MSEPYRFSAAMAAAEPDAVDAALRQHGCAIVENVLDRAYLAELNEHIAAGLAATVPDTLNPFNGQFTKRFGRLLWRVPKVRELARHPVTLGQLDRTLLPMSPRYKLSFSGVMHVMAGQKSQVLHRDNTPFENPSPPVLLATMWAAEDFRRTNGATVFVPGSHLWAESRCPVREELACAEMPAGSVLFYYGNLIHGAGKCVEGTRTGVSLQYAVSWLESEEKQYLATPPEVARTFDEELLKLIGYDMVARNWGEIDSQHLLNFLLEDGKPRSLDQPGYQFSNGTCRSLVLLTGKPRTADHHYHVTLDDD